MGPVVQIESMSRELLRIQQILPCHVSPAANYANVHARTCFFFVGNTNTNNYS